MLNAKKSKHPLYLLQQRRKLQNAFGASAYCMNVLKKLTNAIGNVSGLFCVV